MPEERNVWIREIKRLREEHGVSIFEAEALALGDPRWRRWVEKMINSDERCRRMALSHIRYNGDAALVQVSGNRFKVR
jgi:hypothetical protein